jgi:hypothetical protein
MTDREQDREAFEKWARGRLALTRPSHGDVYLHFGTVAAWGAWQAATAAATEAQADTATTRLLGEFQIKYAAEKNRSLDLEAKLAAAEADIERWARTMVQAGRSIRRHRCGTGGQVSIRQAAQELLDALGRNAKPDVLFRAEEALRKALEANTVEVPREPTHEALNAGFSVGHIPVGAFAQVEWMRAAYRAMVRAHDNGDGK